MTSAYARRLGQSASRGNLSALGSGLATALRQSTRRRCALRRVRSVAKGFVNSKLDFTKKEPLGSGFNPPVIGEDTPNVRLLQHVPSTGKAPAATACKFAALPRAIRSKARQSPPWNATTLSESAWPLSPQHVWCQQEKCSKTRAGCGVAGCWVCASWVTRVWRRAWRHEQ